jgi:hypothetical protein
VLSKARTILNRLPNSPETALGLPEETPGTHDNVVPLVGACLLDIGSDGVGLDVPDWQAVSPAVSNSLAEGSAEYIARIGI